MHRLESFGYPVVLKSVMHGKFLCDSFGFKELTEVLSSKLTAAIGVKSTTASKKYVAWVETQHARSVQGFRAEEVQPSK